MQIVILRLAWPLLSSLSRLLWLAISGMKRMENEMIGQTRGFFRNLFLTIFKIKLRFSYIMTVLKWTDIVIFRVISPPTGVTRSSPLCLFFYAPQAFVWHLNTGSLVHSLNLSRNARLVLFTVSPMNGVKKRNHTTSSNFRCHNISVYWPLILVVIVIVISLLWKFRFCGLNKRW